MEHPAYTLAALSSAGGIIAYARKGSIPSLIGGLTVGILYGTAGYLLHKNADWGLETAIGASVLLGGASIPRAFKTRKPVPITMSLISTIAFGYYVSKYREFYF